MRLENTFLIKNKLGLHARAATVLAQLAVQFDASITLFQDEKEAAGDSVLALMLLESSQGKEVKVVCEGPDAEHALHAVGQLIAQRFNEQE
ncbi:MULTISPECIES: HPr family phosphocarrier protein [Pseudoalteromonas]|jgi:phosphocarrier protein NPr|uniref:Phosphocarrier protein NPr (HPr-like), nitrogen-related n=3 Tax=Pseudoalteromonas TaxID=53246 RepID=Q3IG53_PSET1|nr:MULTISPECIES: HPr family phosphocarrier protein [Pseudoalteromonas]ALS34095.1 phosphocarrier protein NPr [Pseudoalteromonas translucida KMM 520]ASM55173.1 phosphocarrier protein NPr [Pseudoalteromonas nigrifaciens]MBB1369334.1 HPr family phosphocarrier protein [Pseudoalteromonas sp. SR45-4]MBB1405717.1 HPr family phosphocarrier protein [Pseudoalteromonas sp. SG44-5]MBE0419822.1 HPr family phosphocarrier protein [Pseudoalteromonas nigrifaciens]|tara:strand:+ start:27428 stop:27700 length:273 start_codon:yes stop_codon:yes gene_type:complete